MSPLPVIGMKHDSRDAEAYRLRPRNSVDWQWKDLGGFEVVRRQVRGHAVL
jgi:hypothetical protein